MKWESRPTDDRAAIPSDTYTYSPSFTSYPPSGGNGVRGGG